MNFQYSIVRVVPSTIAEERLNVAVLVKDDAGVQLSRVKRLDRITTAFPTVDPRAVEMSLAGLEDLQRDPDVDLMALSRSTRGAVVQVSPPAATVGLTIESELRELFELYVEPTKTRPATYPAKVRSRRRVAVTGA